MNENWLYDPTISIQAARLRLLCNVALLAFEEKLKTVRIRRGEEIVGSEPVTFMIRVRLRALKENDLELIREIKELVSQSPEEALALPSEGMLILSA